MRRCAVRLVIVSWKCRVGVERDTCAGCSWSGMGWDGTRGDWEGRTGVGGTDCVVGGFAQRWGGVAWGGSMYVCSVLFCTVLYSTVLYAQPSYSLSLDFPSSTLFILHAPRSPHLHCKSQGL